MPYSHKRSREAEQRRSELKKQKSLSRKFIRDYMYKDRVTREEVNLVTKDEVENNLQRIFKKDGYYLSAVPNVDRGDVLDVPNIYHLELFPFHSD
jgi:hypothetical protein